MEQTDRFANGLPIDAGDWADEGMIGPDAAAPRRNPAGMDGLIDFARDRLGSMVEDARDSLVDQVRGLKALADVLTGNLPDSAAPVGRLVGQAGSSIDAIADALADKSVDELVEDGRALVRAQPAAAVGAAIAIGFLAGRFLRAARD